MFKVLFLKKAVSFTVFVTLLFSLFTFGSAAFDKTEYLSESNYFYQQLTSYEKTVYNCVLNSTGGLHSKKQGEIQISFSKGSELISYYSEASLKSLLDKTVVMALSAIISDHPELYWVGVYSYNYKIKKTAKEYKIESFDLVIYPDTSWNKTLENYQLLLKTACQIEITGSTDYEKVLAVHDFLCKKLFYPSDIQKYPNISNAFGALCCSYAATCEGYSEAFKLICTLNGIECITVFGESSSGEYIFGLFQVTEPDYHAWNYVKMEDGNWYGVDVTWDDQGSGGIYYEYFLSGSQTVAESFSSSSFGQTHKPTGKIYDSSAHLSYPEISKTAYIPKNISGSMLGDVNTDGKISVSDAKLLLEYIAGKKNLSFSQKANADVNSDGKMTVTDAKWILQYIAQLRYFN